MNPLIGELKAATADLHTRMERLPFFPALADGSLPLDSYVNQMRAFAVVFGSLERTVESLEDAVVKDLQSSLNGRYRQLLQDLEVFADRGFPDVVPAVQAALELAHAVRQLGADRSRALVGYIYTFGGTLLGNRVHLADVRRLLQGSAAGDAFYAGFAAGTDEAWRNFATLANALAVSAEERRAIIAAAQDAFAKLTTIHVALYPLPEPGERRFAATSLNPEAGNHPIPQNPLEIRAALTAGRRCREEFPYFDARYGERGRRYTSSDAAWLATLVDLDNAGLAGQVVWLGDFLARLGMPRILLERQLELLVEELVAGNPEQRVRYEKLQAGIDALRQAREIHFSEAVFRELAAEAEARLAGGPPGIANLGVLIVSAVADERSGIPESAAKLAAWLLETGRLPAGMATAIDEVFGRIRARLRPDLESPDFPERA